jgi:hypothetical protein
MKNKGSSWDLALFALFACVVVAVMLKGIPTYVAIEPERAVAVVEKLDGIKIDAKWRQ